MAKIIKGDGSVPSCPMRREALKKHIQGALGEKVVSPVEKVAIGTVFNLDTKTEIQLRINFENLPSILVAVKVSRDGKGRITEYHSPFADPKGKFHSHRDIDGIRRSVKLIIKEFISDIPERRARILLENKRIFSEATKAGKIALAP